MELAALFLALGSPHRKLPAVRSFGPSTGDAPKFYLNDAAES